MCEISQKYIERLNTIMISFDEWQEQNDLQNAVRKSPEEMLRLAIYAANMMAYKGQLMPPPEGVPPRRWEAMVKHIMSQGVPNITIRR
jgi:hypothetical protein